MAILAREILADNPRRFYRMSEKGGAYIFDSGLDRIPLGANNRPTYNQAGGIPSRPNETSVLNANSSSHFGLGTGVGGDPTGNGSPGAWTMMVIVKADASAGINEWLFSQGSSLGTIPLFGLALVDSAGRPQAQFRNADNVTRSLNAPAGTDIRGVWKVLHWEQDPTDATTGFRLYIDGSNVASTSLATFGATPTIFDRMAVASLQRNAATPGSSAPGHFQYAALFDYALGQTRITAHMNAFNDTPAGNSGSTIKPLRKN